MRTSVLCISLTLLLTPRTLDAYDTNISIHGAGSMTAHSGRQHREASEEGVASRNATLIHGRSRIKNFLSGDLAKQRTDLRLGDALVEKFLIGARPTVNESVWKCNNICVHCMRDQEEFTVQVKRAQSAKNYFHRFTKTVAKVLTLGIAHFFFDKMPDECSSIAIKGKAVEENEGDTEKMKDLAKKDYRKVYDEEPYLLYQFLARGVCGGLANLKSFSFKGKCIEAGGTGSVALGREVK